MTFKPFPPKVNTVKLTEEQIEAVDTYNTTDDCKLIAYAGAGKTSTLVAMANSDDSSGGLYLAFNKRIAEDADKKFPMNVRCSTAHSLAYRTMMRSYDKEKMTAPLKLWTLGLPVLSFVMGPQSRNISYGLIRQGLNKFMQSAAHQPELEHIISARDLERKGYPAQSDQEMEGWREEIARAVRDLWHRMSKVQSDVPLTHDGYLKMWALSKPEIPTDTLFVDEAQDLNPVLVDVVTRQRCQVVSVGDSHQQIYEWRGAVDALKLLGGSSARLTQSFRFGHAVAKVANRLLAVMGETVPLRGSDWNDDAVVPYQSDQIPPEVDAVLCRTNAGVMETLIANVEGSRPLYVPGGVQELRDWVTDAQMLQDGLRARPGDLEGFKSWPDVVEFAKTEDGEDLARMVALVTKYGCRKLLALCERVVKDEEPGCLAVMTTHKAKGSEWASVMVSPDYCLPNSRDPSRRVVIPLSRVRLLYVAVTRAKTLLLLPHGVIDQHTEASIVPDNQWKGYFPDE